MMERINEIMYAIIHICGNGSPLSPTTLRTLSQFFDTLQKVHAFVRSQVDLGLFRRILRYTETAALLEDCNTGLQHVADVFAMQAELDVSAAIADFKDQAEVRHEELMELLHQANSTTSTFSLYQSSNSSLGLLPASPQIFYGRDRELKELVQKLLGPDPFRTVILGPGGIGKSSLALAVLHHPNIISHFGSHRYFISLESSTSDSDMLSSIAAFFNIDDSPKLSRAIVRYLRDLSAPCVLVLDNLEDCWESTGSRGGIEDFLSLISEIPHLHLVVTMRGAERPGKAKWTRPFFPPLDRLDDSAARQTFLDIVDEIENNDLAALLALTDNLPLAITLMANITSYEGSQSVLQRWESESTSLLSEGFGKQANLDKSIMISLSSPRMLANPHARELLSLVSLTPDGISLAALAHMDLPFSGHISSSKSTLLRCSLIYTTADGRLRALAPIRQCVSEKFPPSADSFDALCRYFYDLASLFRVPTDLPNRELIQRLSVEFANVRAVTNYALARSLHLADTVRCTIDLMHFNASARSAAFELSQTVARAVQRLGDPLVKGEYLLAQARVVVGRPQAFQLTTEALQCFEEKDDAFGQVRALYTLASHFTLVGQFQKAIETSARGASLAEQSGNPSMQALCMTASSKAYRNRGDLQTALGHAHKARRLAQASGNMTAEAWVTQQYASCRVMVGDYAGGAALCAANDSLLAALGLANMDVHAYRNSLNVTAEIFDRRTEYDAARAAHSAIELGDLESARQRVEAAQRDVAPGDRKAAGIDTMAQIALADLDFHSGNCDKAKAGFRQALASANWLDLGIIAMEKLSNVGLKTNNMQMSVAYSVLLLAAALKTRDLAATHQALRRLGDISLASHDETTAMSLFQVALDGFKLMGIHRGMADCLIRLGDEWNKNMNSKVTVETLPVIGGGNGNEPWKEYNFVVVRTIPQQENRQPTFMIVIKSEYLLKACKDVIQTWPGISWHADPLWMEPEIFLTWLHDFTEYRDALVARKRRTEQETHVLSSVNLLLSFLAADYRTTIATIDRLTTHNEITFDLLYAILVPRTLVVARCAVTGLERLFQLQFFTRTSVDGVPVYQLGLEGVDLVDRPMTQTVVVGRVSTLVYIPFFKGAMRIDKLDAFPLKFHPAEAQLRETIARRGQKWVDLIGVHHMQYNGIAALKAGCKLLRHIVKRHSMVDRATFHRLNANYSFPTPVPPKNERDRQPIFLPPGQSLVHTQANAANETVELTAEDLLLTPTIVYGFSLSDKIWLEFDVTKVLPTLLRSLVEAHHEEAGFDDFVKGKGAGLVVDLFGPPGVGKTFSAEATTIVLIDKADVFLERRSVHDLERNAMVAVFLRHVEYYRGILFLTTNRVQAFDEAFLSRIHVALRFGELNEASRAQVRRAFVARAGVQMDDAQIARLAQRVINGRQIKNAVRTAHSLALARKASVGLSHFVETLDAMDEFTEQFEGMKVVAA
ncbi:AAA domain-containing protein [Mycena sanguinolenta]|uniref:AAA domain-containing protein n=1 Tax=Mycena sanguinolenta TaxID=230812 RepID=A0A8H6XJM8_9AGAR|nr:AAA domain-containing protein [Mycena sanguinolenta]